MGIFRVAIHYGDAVGTIEYDDVRHDFCVHLADAEKRREVEEFLCAKHVFNIARKTLRDFQACEFFPVESVDKFKIALTEVWKNTGVFVDWSRPVTV